MKNAIIIFIAIFSLYIGYNFMLHASEVIENAKAKQVNIISEVD